MIPLRQGDGGLDVGRRLIEPTVQQMIRPSIDHANASRRYSPAVRASSTASVRSAVANG